MYVLYSHGKQMPWTCSKSQKSLCLRSNFNFEKMRRWMSLNLLLYISFKSLYNVELKNLGYTP